MSDYKMTIGLEIHAELKTSSKMFCGCANATERPGADIVLASATPDSYPNTLTCPICLSHPGTLPVINKEAVRKVLLVGTAVGGKLADFTEFDRKNYFYPDIPKGYQISQYKYPLVSDGSLAGVLLTRIHLEEDTARSTHDTGDYSLVDFNRAGVPLMELVTEPVIHSAEDAMKFSRELQLLLQYLGASDANMEKGEMRVEVNISVSRQSHDTEILKKNSHQSLGTKVEVKNINSHRAAGKAIEFEYARQIALIESGGEVVQETRGWDENKGKTFSQRLKESAHDYRYFPEPDLPKLLISEIPEFSTETLKNSLPELPQEKRDRFAKDFGIKSEDIEVYIQNKKVGDFFEEVIGKIKKEGNGNVGSVADAGNIGTGTIASNYITSDLIGLSKNTSGEFSVGHITPDSFAKLITLVHGGDISSRGAKDILKIMFESGGIPKQIAEEKGLIQKNNEEELKEIISKIIFENTKSVEEYKNGKESLLQFFVGQGMKATRGSGNPELIKKIFLELVSK